MTENELARFEAELKRAQPARLSEKFMAKLRAAKRGNGALDRESLQSEGVWRPGWSLWAWLSSALAVIAVGFIVVHGKLHRQLNSIQQPLAIDYGLKADDLQVNQELISSYEVVATLPTGEPVRFRCRKWEDQLVVKDKKRGVEIQQDSPRVEVVPVRFETY